MTNTLETGTVSLTVCYTIGITQCLAKSSQIHHMKEGMDGC